MTGLKFLLMTALEHNKNFLTGIFFTVQETYELSINKLWYDCDINERKSAIVFCSSRIQDGNYNLEKNVGKPPRVPYVSKTEMTNLKTPAAVKDLVTVKGWTG